MLHLRNTFLVLMLGYSFCVFSQQDPQITHNMFNKFMYNPAVAGAYPELHATLLHRSQWVGLEGAPNTSNLNAHAYVCLLYTSPSPRDATLSRMPSSA